jgi:hypothetical protein
MWGKFLLVVDYYESKSKRFELAAFSNLTLLLECFNLRFHNSKNIIFEQQFWNDGDDIESKYDDDIDLVIFTGRYTTVRDPFRLYLFGRLPLEFFHTL